MHSKQSHDLIGSTTQIIISLHESLFNKLEDTWIIHKFVEAIKKLTGKEENRGIVAFISSIL